MLCSVPLYLASSEKRINTVSRNMFNAEKAKTLDQSAWVIHKSILLRETRQCPIQNDTSGSEKLDRFSFAFFLAGQAPPASHFLPLRGEPQKCGLFDTWCEFCKQSHFTTGLHPRTHTLGSHRAILIVYFGPTSISHASDPFVKTDNSMSAMHAFYFLFHPGSPQEAYYT
jgi:hypothetical protein